MHNKKFIKMIATLLVLALLMSIASTVAFAQESPYVSTHEKINLTDVTGEIVKAPLLTSAASSVAKEKAWYEYVFYSPEPVFHTYLSENMRISFYDPYEYSSALIMEVDDTITEWSSNNSMQVSYTTGESIVKTNGESFETKTEVLQGYTDKEITTTGPSTVETIVNSQTDSYNTSKSITESSSSNESSSWNIGAEIELGVLAGIAGTFLGNLACPGFGSVIGPVLGSLNPKISAGTNSSSGSSSGNSSSYYEPIDPSDPNSKDENGNVRTGYTKSTDTTTVNSSEQKKTVETVIADRITAVTGSTINISTSISFDESTTVTKMYDAAYFNDRGSPLQWKIIKYNVKMPMRMQVEYLIDGEWIFGESDYCAINTIQGTCRAWLENNVAYYEHWGTGEPVTWDGFWGQFFTEESLIAAYKNKLYPDN